MHNLEMRLCVGRAEWRVYPLARSGCWLACWDQWRPRGGGLLARYTCQLGWDEAKRMIAQVAAMDNAAFLSWHAQTLTAWGSATEAQAVPPSRIPPLATVIAPAVP